MNRYKLFAMSFSLGIVKYFLMDFYGKLMYRRDAEEVSDVYNRGNDFYGWFLDSRCL